MKRILLAIALLLLPLIAQADCPMGLDPSGLGRPPVIAQVWFYGFSDGSCFLLLRNVCRDTDEVLWWATWVFNCPDGSCEAVTFPETVPWFLPPRKQVRARAGQ